MKKLFLTLGAIALMGAGCQAAPSLPSVSDTLDEIPRVQETFSDTNYDFVRPENWQHFDKATQIINETQGRVGTQPEQITPSIVQDPTNEDVYYFATYMQDKMETEFFTGIYRYDVSDHNWDRLYKVTQDFQGATLHFVIGYDSGSLIIRKYLHTDPHLATVNCTNLWLPPIEEHIVAMSLDDPYGGFDAFTVPDEVHSIELERQQRCNKQMLDAII